MRHGDHLELERLETELAAERDLGDRHLVPEACVDELAAQNGGGERCRIDRRFQPRPQVRHGAEMILVGMRQHDAHQGVSALHDEGRIRHHHLDAGHGTVGEADAEIDHQPLAGRAVEVEVHADLAGPAKGQEQQLVVRRNGHRLLRRQISSKPSDIRSGSM